ncbi:SGNH/GDSL hydrolase family protein [Cohnella hashimotonis]|uniref:SGNH/GDSL hydrolase family protein n=1 Tax=Cohnella hashimotonis TaxID=2826895 RepID=A0ABT6TJP2_9BACL|nr:SGNH/GDSL hydrolase family protein [Cohnella hashimotonis]MDI4647061.1 SGNH/GDSL hydrolase family protein [Cohnella hashimotonis]
MGQWLGDGTPSFNDDSQPHVDQLLHYVPFTPTFVVIQAPIVNEYLRQTPLAVFWDNLLTLTGKLRRHFNADGEDRTDLLLLTTPGDKRIAFEGAPSAAIGYEDYYETLRAFSRTSGFGLIDFAKYFADCVHQGLLDYELLFDDPIHPSPFVNEFIACKLGQAIDLLM